MGVTGSVTPYLSRRGRCSVRAVLPSDLTILAAFLYGADWRRAMVDDTRLRSQRLARFADGRWPVPAAVADFVLRRAADRWLLAGWQAEPLPAGLSPATAAELARRVEAARRAANLTSSTDSQQADEE